MRYRKGDRATHLKQVRIWLDQSWPAHRMWDAAHSLWKCDRKHFDSLLADVRSEQKTDLSIDRPEFLAQQMTRLEALAVKAQEEGNLAVALGCIKELNALAKLHSS